MDLFPKDYKKTEPVAASVVAPKPSLSSILNKLKEKFSSLKGASVSGGGGGMAIITKAKGTLLRLGVIVSSSAFVLVLVLWGSVVIYKNVLTGQINDLKKKQAEVFNEKDKETAAKIVDFEAGSALVQNVLKSHIYTSSAFDKLAAATVPRVQWQSFDLSVQDSSINVKGFAADYATLAKQILALADGGFSSAVISNISMDKSGGVSFGAAFSFDPKILQKQ